MVTGSVKKSHWRVSITLTCREFSVKLLAVAAFGKDEVLNSHSDEHLVWDN
jgi:hypothetical protein